MKTTSPLISIPQKTHRPHVVAIPWFSQKVGLVNKVYLVNNEKVSNGKDYE